MIDIQATEICVASIQAERDPSRDGGTHDQPMDVAGPVRVRAGQCGDRGRADRYCAGQTSMDADGNPLHEGDLRAQLSQALDNLEAVLRASGCGLSDVVRLNYYTTDLDGFFAAMDVVSARLQEAGCRPAMTLIEVSRLALPPLLVEVEATAVT
jgi:enamine deaminase RidA (YjgF/YER057c/UK114 family)